MTHTTFRPTCPRCGARLRVGQEVCACGVHVTKQKRRAPDVTIGTRPMLQPRKGLCRVVEFTGRRIEQGQKNEGRFVTDWHVVDERGCTQKVFSADGTGTQYRRQRAQRYADQLNAALEREDTSPTIGKAS